MDQDRRPGPPAGDPLNVLILYDHWSVFTNTVPDHLESFARFSRHRIAYAHAAADGPLTFPLDQFDAVVLHYSIRLAFDWHISPEFAWALRSFRGLKALFIQDEYDHTWRACQWIEQLGIGVVFTCVPPEHVRSIYTRVDHDRGAFPPTLTGYLPIDSDLGKHVKPLADRPIVIGYRGRALPFKYGQLGQEKLTIGVRMRAECESRGIPHDIEWTEGKRIYGPAWVDFVASCRATLGTESGSNVFDFDGTLASGINAALKENPRLTYAQVEERFLAGRERDGLMNQVSPRIFEAVALRTGLILFEGTYSGVVKPDKHFVPLKKDFSNVGDVLRRVQDDRELEAMTDRAYRHVIESGAYTYPAFVRQVDDALSRHAGPSRRTELPDSFGWVRELPPPTISPGGSARWKWFRRLPYRGAKAVFQLSGLKRARRQVRKLIAAQSLIFGDAVLREFYRTLRSTPASRTECGSRGRLMKELLRLALLRHVCRACPTVLCAAWATIRFEPAAGRVVFTSNPIRDLPPVIASGQAVVDQALAAVRDGQIREIIWEYPAVKAAAALNLGKVGNVEFNLGPDRVFRFTALERLSDVAPETAVRVLAHVAAG